MPKISKHPVLIDQQKTLTSGHLSKQGYFKQGYKVTGSTGWTSNRHKDLDVVITSNMQKDSEYIKITYYDYNDQLVTQKIYLQSAPSNLGKGLIWKFICPFTNTICKNLIFVNNRFMHRSNVKNAMYTNQADSKYWRKMFQLQPNLLRTKRILDEPDTKNYKKFYNGKVTKRYKKHQEIIAKWLLNQEERNILIKEKIDQIITSK